MAQVVESPRTTKKEVKEKEKEKKPRGIPLICIVPMLLCIS
jgi:hypothetical protein